MVLKLTSKTDDKTLYVNSDRVCAWDAAQDGGSRVVFAENHAYLVKESPQEIKCLLKRVGKLFCNAD